jgi:hypothetical protein
VSSPLLRFAFIDAVHAAELLQVSTDTIVDWVAAGTLRAYGGKPTNPFLRSADVAALIAELGVAAEEPPKRTKSASARVQARLTADARWSEIAESEIRDWEARADPARRQAARTAAMTARARLDLLLEILTELG